MSDDKCAQCGKTLAPWPYPVPQPEATRDENGVPMQWCSSACSDAWMAADPKRREGWIAVGDLTPERLNEMLGEVGLGLAGAKECEPS